MRLWSPEDFPQRTICQVHRELYRMLCRGGLKVDAPEIALLRECYAMGKRMGTRLRQLKNDYDDGWYEVTKTAGAPIDADESADWIEKLQARMPVGIGHGHAICCAADILGLSVRSIAEIGVHKGKCSKRLRKHFPDAELHLVDAWASVDDSRIAHRNGPEKWEEIYNDIVRRFSSDKTHIHRMLSLAAAKKIEATFDVVFIDACHRYHAVAADIEAWRQKLNSPALICGHDYNAERRSVNRGVRKAVHEAFGDAVYCGPDLTWFYYIGAD
jgi:hypothetical protein